MLQEKSEIKSIGIVKKQQNIKSTFHYNMKRGESKEKRASGLT